MRKVRLLNLEKGVSKAGRPWGRVVLRTIPTTDNSSPRIVDFWVTSEVIDNALASGLTVDSDVFVSADLDETGHLVLSGIRPITGGK